MVVQTSQRVCSLESLEHRTFLSGVPIFVGEATPVPKAAVSYNLMRLNAYDQRGATWKHNTSGTVSVGSQKRSVSGSSTVTVSRTPSTFDKHLCNVVVSSGGGTSTTKLAWYTDATGTYTTANIVGTELGQFDMRLHDSRVAPATMRLNQSYSDTGTFTGTFKGGVGGQKLTGTVSGSTKVGSKLVGLEDVTVPAGSFSAVKGVWDMKLNGQMNLRLGGQSASASFSMTGTSTFWAVPGKGMVKGITSMTITLSVAHQGSVTVKLAATSVMTSFTPGSVKSPKVGLFADNRRVVQAT